MANNDNDGGAPAEEEALDEDLELDEDEEEEEEEEDGDKGKKGDEDKKRKPEDPTAKKSRLERELKQHQKKHPELYKANGDLKEKPVKKAGEEATGPDYAAEAFLLASGLKTEGEQELAKRIAKETNKDLKTVVGMKYFQTELKELRETEAAEAAAPRSKRGSQNRTDDVAKWLDKDGLPPNTAENKQLRRDIVKARTERARKGGESHFASTGVVYSGRTPSS